MVEVKSDTLVLLYDKYQIQAVRMLPAAYVFITL